MGCSLKVMAILHAKLMVLVNARSTMVVAGMRLEMGRRFLLVWTTRIAASVLQDSRVMVWTVVKTLMNAERRKPASAPNAAVRILGAATIARVAGPYCTSGNMILV
uniref:Secreted protein n=1 Tax=Opuntia streptacantha TaxID=393608 RepID=A0A7C8Z5X9_OPUST